jgi:hypothetical protein
MGQQLLLLVRGQGVLCEGAELFRVGMLAGLDGLGHCLGARC